MYLKYYNHYFYETARHYFKRRGDLAGCFLATISGKKLGRQVPEDGHQTIDGKTELTYSLRFRQATDRSKSALPLSHPLDKSNQI